MQVPQENGEVQMSKLKVYHHELRHNEYAEFCLKYEVDKVIAEKDAEIVELKKQVHDYTLGLFVIQATAEKEARHHKYKRCEAMARWCEAKMYNIRRKPLCDMDDHEGWQHDDEFWQRWHKRWLKLAEKFKDCALSDERYGKIPHKGCEKWEAK